MFASRRHAVAAARKAEMLDSFESAGLGYFWATDPRGNIEYLTPAAFSNLGWNRQAVTGTPISNHLLPAEDPDKADDRPLSYLLSARNAISGLTVKLKTDIGDVWWEVSGKPQFDAAGTFLGYRGSAQDITHDRAQMQTGDRRAQLDSLTGLPNKTQIKRKLTHTLSVFRNTKQSCAVLMVDLNRFKQVNETLGQASGNELLKQAAARLTRVGAEKATAARLSADKFLIVIPDIDDRGVLGDFSQRFIQTLSQPYTIDGGQANVGASVGIAVAPYDGIEADEVISAAEMALYAAKGSGHGHYRFYSSDLKAQARRRGEIENELREAVAKDQLRMFYQPIVDAKTYKLKCVEALIRWDHPERGWISPAEFIPIAEESGVIRKVGAWALKQVCEDASQWPVEIRAAINVSAVQFEHDDFVQIAKKAIKDSDVDPSRIEFEITESVFIGDYDGIMKAFKGLKGLGARLSLDDFGTGYSSLSYLRNAPFDKIKIDQSFVRGCTEPGNNNAAIIRAVVSLAEALEMETVAEGIEAKDELELVKRHGATNLQGLIFSGAVSNAELLTKLNCGELIYEPRGPEKYRADRRTEFRRIHLIHDDHRYDVLLRNLSKSGGLVEGLLNVPMGTKVVLDLGGGQLAVATVMRSHEYSQGLQFETPLISDGADGLCTRHRVSPYQIEAAGRPLAALPEDPYAAMGDAHQGKSRPKAFVEVDMNRRASSS